MFEHLAQHRSVVVTGPQRSGTRITAKIIAADTGKAYIDEANIYTDNYELLLTQLEVGGGVVQCPGLMHRIHEIDRSDTLIVVCMRSVADIIASEERINWRVCDQNKELRKYGVVVGFPSRIKYCFWEFTQKPNMLTEYLEYQYEALADHPLFVSKDQRRDFIWNQTV